MCSFAAEPKCPAVWQGRFAQSLGFLWQPGLCFSVRWGDFCPWMLEDKLWHKGRVRKLNSFCYNFSHSGISKCWFWSVGTSLLFPNSALDIVITILYASREKFNPHYLRGQDAVTTVFLHEQGFKGWNHLWCSLMLDCGRVVPARIHLD